MWVRGLKLLWAGFLLLAAMSHPMWVRGLKQNVIDVLSSIFASHPMWVRGLKPRNNPYKVTVDKRRTPCGCVD